MALIEGNFYSTKLKNTTRFKAYLPFDTPNYCKESCKVLILLHGLTDAYDTWFQMTTICRYAYENNFLIVTPEGWRNFYCDLDANASFGSYITDELPQMIERFFGIVLTRENTIIAGNSMGGYGALKAAFQCPERFGACGAFSPVVNIQKAFTVIPEEQINKGEPKLFSTQKSIQEYAGTLRQENFPHLYVSCGQQDFLYEQSTSLHHYLEKCKLPHKFEQWDGIHSWKFWEESLAPFFQFLKDCTED